MVKPYERTFDENPYASKGLQRRRDRDAGLAELAAQPAETYDPYEGNALAETTRAVMSNVVNDSTTGIEALGRGLVGDQEGSQAAARRYQVEAERIRGIGPDIQSFDDAKAAGGGIGDYAAAVGFQGAQIAGDFGSAVVTGGVGGVAVKAGVKGAIRRSVTDVIENRVETVAAREAATKVATREAALAAPTGAKAVEGAMRVARSQVDEASKRASMAEAAAITGRTPRFQRAIADGQKLGMRVGAATGSVPSLNEKNIDVLAKDDTSQSDVFKLAAGTVGAAAISALPVERFLGQFGDDAMNAVRESGTKLLPRMAKEFAKQGLVEGSSEAAQEFTQLASHKWVDDNVELLGPEALNQYLTSFVAGGIAGGAIGVGGEAGRSVAGAMGTIGKGARGSLQVVRERLAEYGASARAAYDAKRGKDEAARPAAGEPMGEPSGSSTVSDLYARATGAAKGFASTVADKAKGAAKSATDRFNSTFNDLVDDADLDADAERIDSMSRAFESGEAPAAAPITRAPNTNPVQTKSRLRNTLLANIPKDNGVWSDPEAVEAVGATLERAFRGEPLEIDDHLILGSMYADPNSGVTGELVKTWVAKGRDLVGGAERLRSVETEADATPADNGVVSNDDRASERDEQLAEGYEPTAQDLESGEGDVVNDTLTNRADAREAAGKPLLPAERVANLSKVGKTDGDPEFDEAKTALRTDLLGAPKRSATGVVTGSNVFYQSGKDAGPIEAALAEPGRVEIEPINISNRPGGELMARAALSIDSLVNRYVNQLDQYKDNAKGQAQRRRAALFQVFADLKSAGIKIRPSSITAGDLKTAKNGTYLGAISERDARELRAMYGKRDPNARKWVEKGPKERPRTSDAQIERFLGEKVKPAQLDSHVRRTRKEQALDKEHGSEDQVQTMGEDVVDSGKVERATDYVHAPMNAPPGGQALEGAKPKEDPAKPGKALPLDTSFVSTQGVASVKTGDPLGEIARGARKQARQLGFASETDTAGGRANPVKTTDGKGKVIDTTPGPREAAAVADNVASGTDPRFDAGVAIGTVRIEEEFTNPIRRAEQLRKLKNPASGLAAKYFNDAYNGKYVSAKVTEGKVDNPEIDRDALREEQGTASFPDQLDEMADSDSADGYDVVQNEALLNAVLKSMGITDSVTVESAAISGGMYVPRTGVVQISPKLRGAERIEVLMHELGHHILFSEIAKAAGIKITDVPSDVAWEGRLELLAEHNPELHSALLTDFNAWKRANPEHQSWKVTRAARAPMHRAERVLGSKQTKAPDDLYSFDEYVADNIARALTTRKEGRTIIGQFFKGIVDQLRSAWRALTGTEKREWAPAPNVDAWVKSLFDRNTAAAKAVVGPVAAAQSKALVRIAVVNEAIDGSWDPQSFEEMTDFVKLVMTKQSRQILDRVLRRGAVVKTLRDYYAADPGALAALDDASASLENRIAFAYKAWKEGALRVGPESDGVLFQMQDNLGALFGLAGDSDYAQKIFNDMATGRINKMREKYDVVKAEARIRGSRQQFVDAAAALKAKVTEPLSKVFESKLKRMMDSGIPAMRELAALIQKPQGTTGEDRGYTPAVRDTTHHMLRQAQAIFSGMGPRDRVSAMDILQRQMTAEHPKWKVKSAEARNGAHKMRAFLDKAYDYAKAAGVDVGKRELFFPITFDLRNPQARVELTALYSQPQFEAAIRELPIFQTKEKKAAPTSELIQNLVDGALSDDAGAGSTTGSDAPNFRGANLRISQFVYALGTDADIKKFASLQSKDSAEVLARYVEPLVKRVEYANRFGADGAEKTRIFANMKRQGASDAELTEADNILKAALGTYGSEGSPTLAALSPALAAKFGGKKSRAFVEMGQAYQNARNLPLSLLSSLVDPMGVAVRNGGDFTDAWDAFKVGVRTLFNKDTRAEMNDALNFLGAADEIVPSMASTQGFEGKPDSKAAKINEWVFKLNGMDTWIRATRFMALHGAHSFLLKHADGKGDTSSRYLSELGVRPGDVTMEWELSPDGRGKQRVKLLSDTERGKLAPDSEELQRDDRVRGALMQFVNEAVLRTNSQQTPLWHSDPYMGLITQYKSFGYAIYDQIGGRISRELQHGNHKVLLAMLSYLPIVILGEMIRGLLQYGFGGNPKRDDWGPGDYALLGAERSGLFVAPSTRVIGDTIGDAQAGRLPGSSQIGPTAGQARDFVTTRDYGKAFESALPWQAMTKKWNDDEPVTTEGATRRSTPA